MKIMVFGAFQGTVEMSMEDNCLFGRVLHIKDVVTYEARTPQDLEWAFRRAVIDYIASFEGGLNKAKLIQMLDLAILLGKELSEQVDLMSAYLEENAKPECIGV